MESKVLGEGLGETHFYLFGADLRASVGFRKSKIRKQGPRNPVFHVHSKQKSKDDH